jgi:hypothetical protein
LGAGLGLSYLTRAAFLPLIPLYAATGAVLLERRGLPWRKPVAAMAACILVTAGPFVAALSFAKGHFTTGAAGRVNYAWEVCGASRSVHWQGEPGDIGRPAHPTAQLLAKPATYGFGSPVPGTYPPWYEPSYWYEGVRPHLKFGAQWKVLYQDGRLLAYLFLLSPAAIPIVAMIAFAGRRAPLAAAGILRFWFLLAPALAYIAVYCLVFLDRRYVAGALALVWLCLAAGAAGAPARVWNRATVTWSLLFCGVFLAAKVTPAVAAATGDLARGRESEWNVHWMLAEYFRTLGIGPGDRIAYIGQGLDAEWARLTGARVVAEVPVRWIRNDDLSRVVQPDKTEVDSFWRSDNRRREEVYAAFRQAGASIAVADEIPSGIDPGGWHPIFAPGTPHLPKQDSGQFTLANGMAFLRLDQKAASAQSAPHSSTLLGSTSDRTNRSLSANFVPSRPR